MNQTRPRTSALLSTICLACSVVLLAAPVTNAQPGPGSEIVFTLSYADLAAELDAAAFGFGFDDVEDFTGLDDASGINAEIRYTRSFFLKQLRIGSAVSVALYEEDGDDSDQFMIGGFVGIRL